MINNARSFGLIPTLLMVADINIFFRFTALSYSMGSLNKRDKNVFLECDAIAGINERYECYKKATYSSLKNRGSVKQLLQVACKNPKNLHLKQHSIGRAALLVSGYNLIAAGAKCKQDCPGGYYHGMSEEWAKHDPNDLSEYLKFSHVYLQDDPHSLGHFHMSAKMNFDKALALCDEFKDDRSFSTCLSGVIHQQFIEFGPKDFFKICSNYSGRKSSGCYSLGSTIYPIWLEGKTAEEIVKICDDLNGKIPDELNQCYKGVGMMLQFKKQPPDLKLCDYLNEPYKVLCIQGLTSTYGSPIFKTCGGGDENE